MVFNRQIVIAAILLVFDCSVAQEIIEGTGVIQKPGVNDGCAKYCDEHFESKGNSSEACKQGCRLFSIIQLTNEKTDFTEDKIRDECLSSCKEGYAKDKTAQAACSFGCRNQTLKTGSVQIELDGSSPFINKLSDISNRFFGPAVDVFKDLRDSMNDLMQSARSSMFPSALGGENRDQNKDPFWSNMMQQMRTMMNLDKLMSKEKPLSNKDDLKSEESKSDESKQEDVKSKTLNLDQILATRPPVGNSDPFGEPVMLVHMGSLKSADQDDSPLVFSNLNIVDHNSDIFGDSDDEVRKQQQQPNFMMKEPKPFEQQQNENSIFNMRSNGEESWPTVVEISQDDWLACVGRRIRHLSMITRWTLCLAMILSLVGMMWICMAVLRSAPKRRTLNYLAPSVKGGVDNVYYTTPPYSASDKAPMIITTTEYLGHNAAYQQKLETRKTPLVDEMPPPPTYEAVTVKAREDEKKENFDI